MLTKNLAPINIMFAGGTLESTIPYLTERNRAKVVPLASMSYDLSCNTKFLQRFNVFGDISKKNLQNLIRVVLSIVYLYQ